MVTNRDTDVAESDVGVERIMGSIDIKAFESWGSGEKGAPHSLKRGDCWVKMVKWPQAGLWMGGSRE